MRRVSAHGVGARRCSGHRANSNYNRIRARSRTPKRAKLVLGASAVHARSRWCSRFFGVAPPQNEKMAFLCEKGAYCELASSSSSLDTASQREPAIRRDFLRARQYSAYPGACGYIRGASSGHNSSDTDISDLSPVPTTSSRRRRPRVLVLVRCHCRGSIMRFLRAPPRAQNRVGVGARRLRPTHERPPRASLGLFSPTLLPSRRRRTASHAQPNCALKQTIISVTGHLECSSFDPVSAELGVVAATAPVPLLIAQVRVVENDGGVLKQVTRAQSRPAYLSSLHSRGGPIHYLSHLE